MKAFGGKKSVPLKFPRADADTTNRGSPAFEGKRRIMRITAWITVLACWLAGAASAWGQLPDTIYARKRDFAIPFTIEQADRPSVKEVQLLVSTDQGRSWRKTMSATANDGEFAFRADRDGLHWFLVRTLHTDGQYRPPSMDGIPPGLIVFIDTQSPQVTLNALPMQADQVGVEWDVRDDTLDMNSLVLEWRPANASGGGQWVALNIERQAYGRKTWLPNVRGPIDVRMRAADRFQRQGSAFITLRPNEAAGTAFPRNDGRPPSPQPQQPTPPTSPATGPNIKYINSLTMKLNYTLEDVGPSGVSAVELYLTSDGRNWKLHATNPTKEPPFEVKLPREGVYGLILVVKSGVGLGDMPPQMGDPPQMWVEVDKEKPVVQLLGAEASRGAEGPLLTITWTANDKNIAPTPISISYAESKSGPWNPIAQNLDNTGSYTWRVPPNTPYKFFVRVEAVDKAGNVGMMESLRPAIIDLAVPKGRLIGVEAVPGNGP